MKLMDALERSESAEPTAARRIGQHGWCKVIVRDGDLNTIPAAARVLFQLEVNEPKRQKHHLVVEGVKSLAEHLNRLGLHPAYGWDPVSGETVDDRL